MLFLVTIGRLRAGCILHWTGSPFSERLVFHHHSPYQEIQHNQGDEDNNEDQDKTYVKEGHVFGVFQAVDVATLGAGDIVLCDIDCTVAV